MELRDHLQAGTPVAKILDYVTDTYIVVLGNVKDGSEGDSAW